MITPHPGFKRPDKLGFINHMSKAPGQLYLWIATILFATSNPVVQKLTSIGAQHLINGGNPISACNVLFVSNFSALMVLIPLFRKQLTKQVLRTIPRPDWLVLILVAILSGALAPALIFTALSQTMVNNVILIGRIEPPLILVLSVWFLHSRLHRWEVVGTLVSLVGVVFTIALQPSSSPFPMSLLSLGKGELLTILEISTAAIAVLTCPGLKGCKAIFPAVTNPTIAVPVSKEATFMGYSD